LKLASLFAHPEFQHVRPDYSSVLVVRSPQLLVQSQERAPVDLQTVPGLGILWTVSKRRI